jgi:hypothetical protein
MSKSGSNKPLILQAQVIEMSAQGMSGRRIALYLKINRRTVAHILAGPEAQRLVTEARERAKGMIEKADAALHKSLDRGSSRTAIAVLRGAGVFETRSEAIVRHHFQDQCRAQEALEAHLSESRREMQGKFGRTISPDAPDDEHERERERIERLARIRMEGGDNVQLDRPPSMVEAFAQAHRQQNPPRRRGY